MKQFLKWINLSIPFIIIIIFIILIYTFIKNDMCFTKDSIISLGALLLALIPFSYNHINMALIEFKTFTKCNRRFDKMNEYLNLIEKFEKTELDRVVENSKTAKQFIQDYLDLCAEEFYLYKYSGIVPRKVWQHWVNGIKSYFWDDNIFLFVLNQELSTKNENRKNSYYGFLEFLENELKLKS